MIGNLFIDKLKVELTRLPTLNGRKDFKQAAVLVPLIKINDEYHILFEKRGAKISQGGEVSFPGGTIDFNYDKNSCDAAIRETSEEIGIEKEGIDILGQLDTVFMPSGLVVDAFVGVLNITDINNLKVSEFEVEYLFTVPLAYFIETDPEIYETYLKVVPSKINSDGEKEITFPAKELGLPRIYHKSWGNGKHLIYLYRYKGEIIWGATAKIIEDLKNRIKSWFNCMILLMSQIYLLRIFWYWMNKFGGNNGS